MIKQVPTNINYQKLVDEFHSLDLMPMIMSNLNQIALQHRGVEPDKQLTESCQSLIYDWDNYNVNTHKEVPLRTEKLLESSFIEPCDFFKGTYIEEVVGQLRKEYNVYRGRMMLSRYKTCLSMHTDPTPRLHVPLITNPDAFMVVDNQIIRLPYGGTYIVDTRLPHTAINAGTKHRIHLVFCVDDY